MQRDFTLVFTDMDGVALSDDSEKPVTLGVVAVRSLLTPEQDTPALEKVERFRLASHIHSAKCPVELSIEEAGKIKMLIGQFFPPLIVGQAFAMLEA